MADFILRKIMNCCEELSEITGHDFLIASRHGGTRINIVSRRDPRTGISYSDHRSVFSAAIPADEALPLIRECISCEQLRCDALREMNLSER